MSNITTQARSVADLKRAIDALTVVVHAAQARTRTTRSLIDMEEAYLCKRAIEAFGYCGRDAERDMEELRAWGLSIALPSPPETKRQATRRIVSGIIKKR